ncbi:zinc metalloproteinase nas-4-like [Branchiostoma floridae x Branchiostoma japonicum]
MHVLGFYLEHTRYDRDNYVTIQWENILTGMRSQFNKRPRSEVDTQGPYDTLSVMHYGGYAFSRDGTLPTITDKSGEPIATRRPNEGMSDLDVTKLNKLYNCAKQPENSDQRMAGFIS